MAPPDAGAGVVATFLDLQHLSIASVASSCCLECPAPCGLAVTPPLVSICLRCIALQLRYLEVPVAGWPFLSRQCRPGDRLRSQAEAIAASLGPWTASARGFARRGSAFRFEAPAEARTKGLHDLRTDWRCSQMKQWLGSIRIDAVMARGQGLRITPQLADLLHKSAGRLDAYAVGVMTGGFKSPALDFRNGGAILQNRPFCGNAAVHGLEHCLWW